jgi:hypothetical protein
LKTTTAKTSARALGNYGILVNTYEIVRMVHNNSISDLTIFPVPASNIAESISIRY